MADFAALSIFVGKGSPPPSLGAVVSVFPTTTRAEDLLDLIGRSIFGVEDCAAPAASLAFGAGFGGGGGVSAVGASTGAVSEAGIGVPSGLSDTVLTGFGSGNCDTIAGAGVTEATTTGGSVVPRIGAVAVCADGLAGGETGASALA